MWLLSDLDGTLTNHKHRLHHAHAKDWDVYNLKAELDPVIKPVREVLQVFAEVGYNIAIITARPDNHRDMAEKWLLKNEVPYHSLFMRKFGDWRPDYTVKAEMVKAAGFTPAEVQFVMDDRESVVQMWRDLGFTCFQTAKDELPRGWTP